MRCFLAEPGLRPRWLLVLVWVGWTLAAAVYHEPWRDEAQAWLVVRSATGLWDLLVRASMESTGPFYYLLLWPGAVIFPAGFPDVIFWLSWLGTLGAVCVLLFSRVFPFWVALCLCFGALLGHEYAVVARLYGWGCCFFLLGLWAHQNNRPGLSVLAHTLCASVQFSFLVVVGGWRAYLLVRRAWRWERTDVYFLVLALLLIAQVKVLGKTVPAQLHWDLFQTPSVLLHQLGTSLARGLWPLRGPLGAAGILLFCLLLVPLNNAGRLAYAVGTLPLVALFVFVYGGMTQPRQAFPAILLWLALLPKGELVAPRNFPGIFASVFLAVGVVFGVVAAAEDFQRPYAAGKWVAERIREQVGPSTKPIRLYATSHLSATVEAAYLETVVWSGQGQFGRPFYQAGLESAGPRLEDCSQQVVHCFFVELIGISPGSDLGGQSAWTKIAELGATIREENHALWKWTER